MEKSDISFIRDFLNQRQTKNSNQKQWTRLHFEWQPGGISKIRTIDKVTTIKQTHKRS